MQEISRLQEANARIQREFDAMRAMQSTIKNALLDLETENSELRDTIRRLRERPVKALPAPQTNPVSKQEVDFLRMENDQLKLQVTQLHNGSRDLFYTLQATREELSKMRGAVIPPDVEAPHRGPLEFNTQLKRPHTPQKEEETHSTPLIAPPSIPASRLASGSPSALASAYALALAHSPRK